MSDKPTWQDSPADFTESVGASGYGPKTAELFGFLTRRVIGQERAAHRLARSFAVYHAGLKNPRKPINAVIFSGPTGIGKTMMAGELAKALIADRIKPPMTTIDCQMFTEHHQLSQLIGSPPGYVGYGEAPLLSQMKIDSFDFWVKFEQHVRRTPPASRPKDMNAYAAEMYRLLKPYISVILFDEVEKAHQKIHNALLGIIDKGEATMANGETADYTHSVVVLTCNIGGKNAADLLSGRKKQIGLHPTGQADGGLDAIDKAIYEQTLAMIKQFFPAEFVGRLRDQIVVFRSLDRDSSRRVLDNLLAEVQERVNGGIGIDADPAAAPPPALLHYTEAFKDFLLDAGVSREFGLRVLEQTVKQYVVLELANAIEAQEVRPGDAVMFDVQNGRTVLRRKPRGQKTVTLALPAHEADNPDAPFPPADDWGPFPDSDGPDVDLGPDKPDKK